MNLFRRGDALIVVDVQNDFLPGGSLAVPRGDEVVPVLNQYLEGATRNGLPVFATRDWHPPNHCSFQGEGGPWPPHCVRGTAGAAFAPALRLPGSAMVISKAQDQDQDAYSGFQTTDLEERLRRLEIDRVLVGGLATDYCVLSTVRDALARGFEVGLLLDAVRPVDVRPGDGVRAEQEMMRLGARPVRLDMVDDAPAARSPAD
jgi:nicotinamidase/pyrazinamidase